MLDALTLYIDRLKGGQNQAIDGTFAPDLLEVDEPELRCVHPVAIKLQGYIAEDHLVLHFSASTVVMMPCAVCNQMIPTPLRAENVVQTIPLSEIAGGLYVVGSDVREALLVELPRTVECSGGRCPDRQTMEPYLRPIKRSDETSYFPFSDIKKPE